MGLDRDEEQFGSIIGEQGEGFFYKLSVFCFFHFCLHLSTSFSFKQYILESFGNTIERYFGTEA